MKITAPGVYDISAEEYHADPCPEPSLSASIAKLLVSSTPLHAWTAHPRLNPNHVKDEHEQFDIGNAAHSLILRDPKAFEIIDAPDWRTKQAKDQREAARECGKIPLLVHQFERVTAMVLAAKKQLDAHSEAQAAFTAGKPEQTLVWREGAVWCRARLDWRPDAGSIFDDYKSTTCADPDVFQRQVINMGHDVQAAFYLRGVRALKLAPKPQFRFIVQEVEEPYALSAIGLAPDFLDLADHKVARAIDIWGECLRLNRWPGYPARTCWLESPAWHEAQFLARDARSHDTERDLRASAEAQAPL